MWYLLSATKCAYSNTLYAHIREIEFLQGNANMYWVYWVWHHNRLIVWFVWMRTFCLLPKTNGYIAFCFALSNHVICFMVGWLNTHYRDVVMSAMASLITGVSIVYWTLYSGVHQRKYQSSASLAFVRGIHRRPVNSPHKGSLMQKTFLFD